MTAAMAATKLRKNQPTQRNVDSMGTWAMRQATSRLTASGGVN